MVDATLNSTTGLSPHTQLEINMGFLYFASKTAYASKSGSWYTNTNDAAQYPVIAANARPNRVAASP